jgi:hypothetical protein
MTATAPGIFRGMPYPYRALLAICSDLDETPTRAVYEGIARFLNTTTEVGPMGAGVGLEIGNTMYFDMPEGQFAYWNTDDAGREWIRALIRSGHIDCFHSFGDRALTRADARRSLDDLSRHGCAVRVWIDHATAASNLGPDIMKGSGDVRGSAVYHADLTVGFGVRYVWRGRVTSVVGQDVPRSLGGIFTHEHRAASARTFAKEWAKGVLATFGSVKYAAHADNSLLWPTKLRDGQGVWEFFRCNPHWQSVDKGETADGFGEVVTAPMLDRLEERRGTCVLYTHLGKVGSHEEPLPAGTRAALRLLARRQDEGRILVATTRRVLDYSRALRTTTAQVRLHDDRVEIDLRCPDDLVSRPPGDPLFGANGLTIYVPTAARPRVTLNDIEAPDAKLNAPDETGRSSVSLPWPRLRYPG